MEVSRMTDDAEAPVLFNTPELDGQILGVNRRTYPRQGHTGQLLDGEQGCTVTVVLVGGAINDYAAYIGQGEPWWVAKHGDKLSFAEACIHFPGGQLTRARYRGRVP
jgi:hypothetical protein